MHTCPNCDRMCDCDGEDADVMTREWVARHCRHECEPEYDEDEEDEGWGLDPNADNSLWESDDDERTHGETR